MVDTAEARECDAAQDAPAGAARIAWRQAVASGVASVLLLGAGVYILQGYLHALAWSATIAVALWPIYRRFAAHFGPKGADAAAPLLFTALIGLAVIAPIATLAVDALAELRALLDYVRGAEDAGLPVPDSLQRLPLAGPWIASWWESHLSHAGWPKEMLQQLNTSTTREIGAAVGANALRRSLLFAVSLLTLFFLFRNGDDVAAQCRVASAKLFGERGERVAAQVIASVHGTLNGLVLVAIGEGVLMGAAYMLTGTPHATLLGMLTIVAAMIPFAAAIAIGVAALLAAANVGTAAAIIIAAWGFIVVFVSDHFVRPQIIGSATKLPFLWVLLGILGGVESFQLLGLFLGPAIVAALIALWRELAAPETAPSP